MPIEKIPRLITPPPMSRRGLLRSSGAVLSGLSLSALIGNHAQAKTEIAELTTTIVTPTQDNPIRINFNENSLGMSPRAQTAARQAISKAFRYADAEVSELKEIIAQGYGVPTDYLLLTHGSSEGIRASIAAHAGENVQLVGTELTYDDGPRHAKNAGMKVTLVPHKEDLSFDIDAMKKAVDSHKGVTVVYLVNPNNPTSTIVAADTLEEWIKSKPANTIFVVDEAYAEYATDPAFRSVDGMIKAGLDNVILLKTFSKMHAMAGMRVGYVLATPKNIEKISRFVGTEDLNYCAVCAAAESFKDKKFWALSQASNAQSFQIMKQALDELKLEYLPSQTNFVFHRVNGSVDDYRKAMKDSHIIVGRAFPPATQWCRVSLGTPGEMLYVAQAMKDLRASDRI